jgi:hypothetical protein
MGSYVEMNDTLQITKEQGFPKELDWREHLKNPYTAEQFKDKIFEFKDKPSIRNYQIPPVRNFLVENIDGKWLYWGLIYILEIKHDYINRTTSGKFKIIHINKPAEMEMAHNLIDRNKETFFDLKQ